MKTIEDILHECPPSIEQARKSYRMQKRMIKYYNERIEATEGAAKLKHEASLRQSVTALKIINLYIISLSEQP